MQVSVLFVVFHCHCCSQLYSAYVVLILTQSQDPNNTTSVSVSPQVVVSPLLPLTISSPIRCSAFASPATVSQLHRSIERAKPAKLNNHCLESRPVECSRNLLSGDHHLPRGQDTPITSAK